MRNGGVVISSEDKGDIEKLQKQGKLASWGLTIEELTKRRPWITIVGVPLALPEEEVHNCIYEQNIADEFPTSTRKSFLSAIKLSHKSGERNPSTCN